MKKFLFILLLLSFLIPFLSALVPSVQADCDMSDLDQKITCLSAKVTSLQGQAQTLSGQIASYDSQIQLTALKIAQTETQINSISGRIDQLEIALRSRANLLQSQIVQTYKQGPLDSLQILFSSHDVSRLISRFKYLQLVQANNRKILHDSQVLQTNYAQHKTLIQESKKKLDAQKTTLAVIRTERDNLLKQTKSSEANYQKLLVQARAELASLRSFAKFKGGGLLPPQPQPDGWYFNQRDNRWGGNCIGSTCGSSPSFVWEVGCLVTSVAMVQKKYGQNITPLNIAQDSSYFFSNTAYMLHSSLASHGFTVNGGNNTSLIEDQLNQGKPVIVHLTVNTSDGHYVVLKSGKSGSYIMNDPWEGPDLEMSKFYSANSINQVITYNH